MNCLYCESASDYFTTHNYLGGPFCEIAIKFELYEVDFYRCQNCGCVFSKKHRELPAEKLALLMEEGHALWEKIKKAIYGNNITYSFGTAPHFQEAMLLKLLGKNEIIDTSDVIDYAAGSGHLSNIAKKYFDISIVNYEPFARDLMQNYIQEKELKKYSLVLNAAMLQCLTEISPFINMNNLIKGEGALFLQTMVTENISDEYFNHIFFSPMSINAPTNKTMQILMDRFNFVSSLYSPSAKSWILFKKEPNDVKRKIQYINSELMAHQIYYKTGFVDYWK